MAIARRGTPTTATRGTGGTSLTFNVPAGVADGDVLYAWLAFGDAVTSLTLAGWTLVDSDTVSSADGYLYRRVASSEPANYTATWTTNAKPVVICAAYSGVDTTTPEDQHGITHGGSTTHATPSLTPSGTGRWSVAFYCDRSTTSGSLNNNWTPDAALSEIADVNDNANPSAPWMSACCDDSNGTVSQAAHSYTATSQIGTSNAVMALVMLTPGAASQDATATPSPIAAATTVPAVSPHASATVNPGAVAAVAALLAVALAASSTAGPQAVTAASVIPAASVTASATAGPVAVAATATVPTAATSAASTATPVAVTAAAGIPAAAVGASSTTTAGTIGAAANVPAPSGSAGTAVTPITVTAAATVPVPMVSAAGNVTVPAATIATTTATPSPAPSTGATAASATITASAGVFAPPVSAGATASPPAPAAVAAIPAPMVSAGGGVSVPAATVAGMTAVPVVSLSAGMTVMPGRISVTAGVPDVAVTSNAPTRGAMRDRARDAPDVHGGMRAGADSRGTDRRSPDTTLARRGGPQASDRPRAGARMGGA